VTLCPFTEHLRERIDEWQALKTLPGRRAVLQQDPVARREHQKPAVPGDRQDR